MSQGAELLSPAVESAAAELQGRCDRFEVFARLGERLELRFSPPAGWATLRSRQVGVACRVVSDGGAGFGAAAGSAARAGQEAARSALAAVVPGEDPLPPREALARAEVPPPPGEDTVEAVREAACGYLEALEDGGVGTVREIRVVAGGAVSMLRNGGFVGLATTRAATVDAVVTTSGGRIALHHRAAKRLAEIPRHAFAAEAGAVMRALGGGEAPLHGLTDVLMAPAVAARVALSVADHLASTGAVIAPVSPVWKLVDARCGPEGLLPLPFDGEGLPSREMVLVGGGRSGCRLATWADARRLGTAPGGAVRPSYTAAPIAGLANLVVDPAARGSAQRLGATLGEGIHLLLPLGDPRVSAQGHLTLAAAGFNVRRGRPAAAHCAVELRVSIRRLLTNLEAGGDDDASFSLSTAVTSPSLLFRRIEVR